LIEISKSQFLKLEKSKFFFEFNKRYGHYPYNHTGKYYWVEDFKEVRQALNDQPVTWKNNKNTITED